MSNPHILIVEDNPDNQTLVTWILEDENYQVSCAGSAEDGLSALEQDAFDLVLMDISLPGMDGKQATQVIRQSVKLQHLPVIALTAHAIKGEDDAILASGVNALVTKPIDEELLLSEIQRLLN